MISSPRTRSLMSRTLHAFRSFLPFLTLASLIFSAQLLLVMHASQKDTWREAYFSAVQWDSDWYINIAEHGYHSEIPPKGQDMHSSNVAFFPGYPYAARMLVLLGMDTRLALLLVAQVAAIGFWTYFLLLLRRRWNFSRTAVAWITAAAFCYPPMFFIVTGYSESLFLFFLLGFLYWLGAGSTRGMILAALHGMGMTATRIVGIPFAMIPVFGMPTRRAFSRTSLKFLSVTVVALAGAALFFLYCQTVFGVWNLYMQTQRIGWDVGAQSLLSQQMQFYVPLLPDIMKKGIDSDAFSRIVTSVFPLGIAALLNAEYFLRWRTKGRGSGLRIGFCICSAAAWAILIAGVAHKGMNAMSRQLLAPLLLLLFVSAQLSRYASHRTKIIALIVLAPVLAILFLLQLLFMYRFTHYQWVA